jgi:ubiquinone/menaquinone biosynthesis C-methylase UbiE
MNPDGWLADARTSYDTVAVSYSDQVREALGGAPYVRAAPALFADAVSDSVGGPVADVGCGPGHVTAYLYSLGVDAFGIDVAPGMVKAARSEHPELHFEVGSMTALDLADESIAGVLMSWSLIHVPDEAVPTVLSGFRRALRPGAHVLRCRPCSPPAWVRE